VVFAERVATLRFLTTHLPASLGLPADGVAIMHGGLTDEEQQRVVDDFKQAGSPVRVLVTGDVASEGVNLHAQCHHLIHYDIPWSLIRIEQRNGRIDRYGQRFPPQITTLLLDPSSERFAGDIRVLSRLIEREHEAHTALGDAASLMGRYSVTGEEDEIRSVLAVEKDLDEVVRAPGQVAAGDDLTGLFARLFQQPATSVDVDLVGSDPGGSGLYPDEISYLEEALHAGFIDPSQPLSNGGVRWRRDRNFGTAELDPPPDLLQRLEVLPQSYLTQRRVTQRLVGGDDDVHGESRRLHRRSHDQLVRGRGNDRQRGNPAEGHGCSPVEAQARHLGGPASCPNTLVLRMPCLLRRSGPFARPKLRAGAACRVKPAGQVPTTTSQEPILIPFDGVRGVGVVGKSTPRRMSAF